MALIKFFSGQSENFNNLENKDNDTIYFLEDTQEIYKGSILMSRGALTEEDKQEIANEAAAISAITVDTALSATSNNPIANKTVQKAISNIPVITVDTALNASSTNPVTNKAVENALHATKNKSVTTISINNTYATATSNGAGCNYMVRNGICYVNLDITTKADVIGNAFASNLPTAVMAMYVECTPFDTTNARTGAIIISANQISGASLLSGNRYLCSFSYPVKY
jgi:hypothetical protein